MDVATLTGKNDIDGAEGNKGVLEAYNSGLNKILTEIRA